MPRRLPDLRSRRPPCASSRSRHRRTCVGRPGASGWRKSRWCDGAGAAGCPDQKDDRGRGRALHGIEALRPWRGVAAHQSNHTPIQSRERLPHNEVSSGQANEILTTKVTISGPRPSPEKGSVPSSASCLWYGWHATSCSPRSGGKIRPESRTPLGEGARSRRIATSGERSCPATGWARFSAMASWHGP